ncbi:hypothetical protein [Actinomadura geliboluensis]|uniref:hypothetical protein n=1 Tax=Actinomadura geliboluensis TaxID=882440 RepID=UPI00371943CC
MSGSGAYDWNYAAAEAAREQARHRELAARLAELRAEARQLEKRLRKKGSRGLRAGASDIAEAGDGESADSLAARVAAAETAVGTLRDESGRLATRELAERLSRNRPPRTSGTPAARTRAADGGPAARSEGSALRERDVTEVRESLLVRAEDLLTKEAARCHADDLEGLAALASGITAARTVQAARTALRTLEERVVASIRRRAKSDQDERTRAGLRALARHAPEADRPRLLAAIDHGSDLEAVSDLVTEAVAEADRAAARERAADKVAAATAEALREIGCEVGEDFATVLAASGDRIIDLGEDFRDRLARAEQDAGAPPGAWRADRYALRVTMRGSQGSMRTSVVLAPGEEPDPLVDTAAQQAFCDMSFDDKVQGKAKDWRGLDIRQSYRLQPGQMPPPAAAEESWQAVEQTRSRRRRKHSAGRTNERARERRHDR